MLQEICAFKPDFSIILGNYNTRSKTLWNSGINTNDGTKIDTVNFSNGLQQLISEQTHLLANLFSWINIMYTDPPSFVVDCGTNPSLHQNCHHQIVSFKLGLKIVYPLPYRKRVWDFKRTNID